MKVKLSVCREHEQEIRAELLKHGIEIDENAGLVLSESGSFMDYLMVKDPKTNERVQLCVREIISVESFGHVVEVYTPSGIYQTKERLYQIETLLDPQLFLRISNSVIIAKEQIRRISPTLSMKFILVMSDGRHLSVTRSYYYIFRESLGI